MYVRYVPYVTIYVDMGNNYLSRHNKDSVYKVIYPKHYRNSNELCIFAIVGLIGQSGQYCTVVIK